MAVTIVTQSHIDPITDTIVSVGQAAQHYGVSKPTVWRWILTGKVASIKLGNSRRTSLEAIARAFATDPVEV